MFLFRDKRLIILIIVIVGLSFLVSWGIKRDAVTYPEELIGNIFRPVQKFFYQTTYKVGDFFGNIFSIRRLIEENKELQERVAQLEAREILINELEFENNQLRDMVEFIRRSDQFKLVGAQVIGRDPARWFDTILIDKGYRHGLERNMPVITSMGVVGHIIEVGAYSSKVILILDNRIAISGLVQETRDNGVLKGQIEPAPKGHLKMVYLPPEAKIFPGQIVITSGLGGIYPKGLMLGEIVKVDMEHQDLAQYAIVRPSADLERLERVFVITDYRRDNE